MSDIFGLLWTVDINLSALICFWLKDITLISHIIDIFHFLACFFIVSRELQNMTNYFLMSLAVADLLVCMIVMPFGAIVFFKGCLPSLVCALASALGIATGLILYDRQEIVNPPLPFKFSPKMQWQHRSGPSGLKIINLLLQARGLLVKVGACSTRWVLFCPLNPQIREDDLRGTKH